MLAQIKIGRAEAQRLRADNPARPPVAVPTKGYDWQGGSLVVPKAPWLDGPLGGFFRPTRRALRKSPPGPSPAPPGAADISFEAGEGFVWLASETSSTVTVGTCACTCVCLRGRGGVAVVVAVAVAVAAAVVVAVSRPGSAKRPPLDSLRPLTPSRDSAASQMHRHLSKDAKYEFVKAFPLHGG